MTRKTQTMPCVATGLMVLGVVLTAGLTAAADGLWEQQIQLEPGWNAVWLEVEPENQDLEAALAGIPLASIWTWRPSTSRVDFIQDPGEENLTLSEWRGYFPPHRPESVLNNLFLLQANRAYLIKIDGVQPVTWRLRGRPVLRSMKWVSDSFNLVGFPVDPAGPPTFGNWFSDSEAHQSPIVYRLDASGTWLPVAQPYSSQIASGEAYWVWCEGDSDWSGPLEVRLNSGRDLNFRAALTQQDLILENRSQADVEIALRQLGSGSKVPLSLERVDDITGEISWTDLPDEATVEAAAGEQVLTRIAVRRAALTEERVEHVMVVTNGLGARRLVAVGANTVQPGGGVSKSKALVSQWAGLWFGTAKVAKVSEAQLAGTTPVETGRFFPLRIIIHVDGSGQVSLLKEVIQMWEEGVYVPHPEDPDFLMVGTPGRYVLVTDDSLIPQFDGVVQRDGQPVGLRLSTVAYDFDGEAVEMIGALSPNGSLSVILAMPSEFPTNPFKHRYHPDHDNFDAQFLGFSPEAYEVTRNISLEFDAEYPGDNPPPDWGADRVGGVYREQISGIHRNTIFVEGAFELQRIAATAVLNQ